MKDRLLVTTALEETWGNGEPVYFLGEWCKLYSRKEIWSKLDANTQPHHWNDRAKLKGDHDYLKSLYERVLPELANRLNQIHGLDKSVKYWRIILGSWLLSYIPILFDRWEALRLGCSEFDLIKLYRINQNELTMIARDYDSFALEYSLKDLWNQMIFERILTNYYSNKVTFLEANIKIPEIKGVIRKKSFKRYLAGIVDKFASIFEKKNHKILFFESYFPLLQLLKLCWKLRIIPRLYIDTFTIEYPYVKIFEQERKCDLLKQANSKFEDFVSKSIMKDIPFAYLEGFISLLSTSKKIKNKPSIILTANAFWGNELFKTWTAEQVENNAKLYISDHGGSFPPLFDIFSDNDYDSIAEKRITWFQTSRSTQVCLPPSKLVGFHVKSKKKYCSVIGMDMHRYLFSLSASPIVEQNLICFENTVTFCKSLNQSILSEMRIKPQPDSNGIGWQTRRRYCDTFGEGKVYTDENYYSVLRKSKLVVCTYSDTTFAEAIASGIPTILVHRPEFYEKIPEADSLIKTMETARIIFSDPLKAANHVNSVWEDLDEWWNEGDVVLARKSFFETALRMKDDWINEWFEFLIKETGKK